MWRKGFIEPVTLDHNPSLREVRKKLKQKPWRETADFLAPWLMLMQEEGGKQKRFSLGRTHAHTCLIHHGFLSLYDCLVTCFANRCFKETEHFLLARGRVTQGTGS